MDTDLTVVMKWLRGASDRLRRFAQNAPMNRKLRTELNQILNIVEAAWMELEAMQKERG